MRQIPDERIELEPRKIQDEEQATDDVRIIWPFMVQPVSEIQEED